MIEILAIMASPIAAFLVAHFTSDRKERVKRRHDVFVALWLTRGDLGSLGRLNPEHVRALNMIEIEFSPAWFDFGREEDLADVVDTWRRYRDTMNLPGTPENWNARDEVLIQLFLAMARVLRRNITRDDVRFPYAPIGYQTNDLQGMALRDAVLQITQGTRAIHITTEPPAEPPPPEQPPQLGGEQPPALPAGQPDEKK